MFIYKGRFLDYKKIALLHPNYMCINTFIRPPRWWRGRNIPEVYPPYEIFTKFQSGSVDVKEYEATYRALIGGIQAYKLVQEVADKNNMAQDIVFMIYGIPSRDYHVDLLIDYLKKYGFELKELNLNGSK